MNTRLGFLTIVCLAAMTAETAVAQTESETESETVSSDAIERALNPPLTRGIRVETRANANAKVDLNIPFEINSSELRPQARQQLVQLETALQNDQLSKYRFEIAGHTDASGSAAYNRTLSRARAESVRQFLVDRGIDPDRLEVVGRGEDDLLHPDDPLHGANRRVEIKNLGEN